MELVNQLVSYLNAHPEDLVALSGLLSVAVQYAVNHVKGLSKLTNALLGLVAVPGVVTAAVALSTSLHASSYPVIVLVGQLFYHSYEALKRNIQVSATASVVPVDTQVDY